MSLAKIRSFFFGTKEEMPKKERPKRTREDAALGARKRVPVDENQDFQDLKNSLAQLDYRISEAKDDVERARLQVERADKLVLIAGLSVRHADEERDLALQQSSRIKEFEAEHAKAKLEWELKIAVAKAELESATDEEDKRHASEDLDRARQKLEELEEQWHANLAEKKLELSRQFRILLKGRFTAPTVLEDDRAILDFIETPEYREIYDVLQMMAAGQYPTSSARTFQVGLVRGSMGVGKTFTTWKAATSISGVTPCYFRLDSFMCDLALTASELEKIRPRYLLAGVLAYVFSRSKIVRLDMDLDEVITKIQNDLALKVNKLILHIDEFQVAPVVTRILVSGCTFTLIERLGIAVIPVVSGVSGVLDTDVVVNATNWSEVAVNIRSLPRDALETSVARALRISANVLRASNNFQVILNDCGNQAYLAVAVVTAIRSEVVIWKRLKSAGKFEDESAAVVFERALGHVAGVYNYARWHRLVNAGYVTGDLTNRESLKTLTVVLIRKIVWLALSKTPFPKTASLLEAGSTEKVSLIQCRDAGMLSLESVVGGAVVAIPLMALVLMDRVGQLLPASIHFKNPFGADWQTLERVAMACLMVQLLTETPVVSIQTLRPGAILFSELDVCVNAPGRVEFYYLGTYIEAERLVRSRMAEGEVAPLDIGDVMLTATNQFAHDGIVILEGSVAGVVRKILWFSQVKAVESINKRTGERAASTLHNGSIQSEILPKMRKGAAKFKEKFPQFKDAFVVFDVFSDRQPPKRDNGSFVLDSNEALFVTRSDTLPMVLGGLAARKRDIQDG